MAKWKKQQNPKNKFTWWETESEGGLFKPTICRMDKEFAWLYGNNTDSAAKYTASIKVPVLVYEQEILFDKFPRFYKSLKDAKQDCEKYLQDNKLI